MQSTQNTEILKWASKGEAAVARALVKQLLSQGASLRVHDGEEWALNKITDSEEVILEALCSTGEDTIKVYTGENHTYRGHIWLIYGNAEDGSELLADWSDTEYINETINAINYL